MPDESIPVVPDAQEELPERNFIAEMSEVLTACSTATMLSDLRAVENAVRKARSIFSMAEKKGYQELELLKILKLIIQVLANYAQMNAFQLEARFAEAQVKGNEIISQSQEALTTMKEISNEEEEDAGMLMIKRTLEYYNAIGPAAIAYIKAEQIGFTGRFDDYRAALIIASSLFRKVQLLDDSDDPTILQLYAYGTNMAERLENRVRYFEFIQREKTNQYINPQSKKVFIIHGHSNEAANSLQKLLEDQFALKSIILKNEASGGDSVMEKFETVARDCGYAFAIITKDDLVQKGKEKYFQARPNVLFELGWFYGRYGRSRVCILKQAETQIPSDLQGIITVNFIEIKDAFIDMQKELRAAGLVG